MDRTRAVSFNNVNRQLRLSFKGLSIWPSTGDVTGNCFNK